MIEKRIRLSSLGNSGEKIAYDLGLALDSEVPVIRKAHVCEKAEADGDMVHAVVSSMKRPDLEGETVDLNFLDIDTVFRPNPVILWNHDPSRGPIGRSEKTWIEDEELHMKVKWAATPFAQEIGGLYKTKFLKSWSIGFISVAFDEKTKTHRPAILIETSSATIGCNLDARVIASLKSADLRRDLNGHVKQAERDEIVAEVKRILAPRIGDMIAKEIQQRRAIIDTATREAQIQILRRLGRVASEDQLDEVIEELWPTGKKKPGIVDRETMAAIVQRLTETINLKKRGRNHDI